jgi:uncharacterized membrane protein
MNEWHWWFGFPWIFFAIFFTFLIVRIVAFRRWGFGYGCGRGMLDAESILKRRLASGDIAESEYQRLREIVRSKQ